MHRWKRKVYKKQRQVINRRQTKTKTFLQTYLSAFAYSYAFESLRKIDGDHHLTHLSNERKCLVYLY